VFTFLKTKDVETSRSFRHIDPQIFDLLQLSKRERECRENFLTLKQELESAPPSEKYYVRMNEMILRRRVENAALYYRFVRRERMRLFHDYIKHLPAYRSVAA